MVLPAEARADRQLRDLGKCRQRRRRCRRPVAAASQEEGALGPGQHVENRRDVPLRPGPGGQSGGRDIRDVRLGRQHVLRQCQHHRPRAPGLGGMEGVADIFRQPVQPVDLPHPFREGGEHRPVVDLLECLAVALVGGDLADEQDHRRGILKGDMHPGRGICGPGSPGDKGDARLARQLSVGLGHHRRAAFLPGDDHVDAAVVKPVERGQIAFARHAKDPAHALEFQLVDEDLSAVAHESGLPLVRRTLASAGSG